MTQITFNSFEELASYLEGWSSYDDESVYDPNGILILLNACLKNLNNYAIEADFWCFREIVEVPEKLLLEKILDSLK